LIEQLILLRKKFILSVKFEIWLNSPILGFIFRKNGRIVVKCWLLCPIWL